MKRLFPFLFKQYPAFLWKKPSIWRVLLLPFLVIFVIFGMKQVKEKSNE